MSIVGGGLFLLVLLILLLRIAAPDVVTAIARPFWGIGTNLTAAAGMGGSGFESKGTVVATRDRLAAQNAALQAENAVLTAKVQDLTTTLGTRQQPPQDVVAGVLAGPPVSPYDVLVVDQGRTSGVAVNAPAFGPGGTPIGRVASVSASSARIMLYSSPGATTEGWLGDARSAVMVKGIGAGGFEATLARDAGAQVGQGVFVPGPGALPIGTVVRVDTDPSSPTVVIHIHPYVNPFSLTWVTIQRAYAP